MKALILMLSLLFASHLAAQTVTDITLLNKLAEQGNTKAQFTLADYYHQGVIVEQDFTQAVYWYKKAAEQGHMDAQFNLATAFDIGEGVAQDLTQAAFWYEKSAMQGLAAAAYNLGILYDEGAGVKANKIHASTWLIVASELKYEPANQALQQTSLFLNKESLQQARNDANALLQKIQTKN